MSTGGAPGAPRALPALDAHRVLAMTAVLLLHASFTTGAGFRHPELGRVLGRFDAAVPAFFIISGFLLSRPFVTALLDGHPLPSTRAFLRRRALRILPAYWFALIGTTVLFDPHPWEQDLLGAWAWIVNLALLPQFGSTTPLALPHAWALGVEVSFCAALPLLAVAAQRGLRRTEPGARARRLARMLCGMAGAAVVLRAVVALTAPDEVERISALSLQARLLRTLPLHLDFFAMGMLGALGAVQLSRGRAGDGWRRVHACSGHGLACWLVAAGAWGLVTRLDPPAAPYALSGGEYLPRQLLYLVAATAWLAPALLRPDAPGRLPRLLAHRAWAPVAAVSLGFFLWHLHLLEWWKAQLTPGYDEIVANAATAVAADPTSLEPLRTLTGSLPAIAGAAWLCALALGAATWWLVERPAARGRRTR